MSKLIVLAVLLVAAHSAYGGHFLTHILNDVNNVNDVIDELAQDPCFIRTYATVETCFTTAVPNYPTKPTDNAYMCCALWAEMDCIKAKDFTCAATEKVRLEQVLATSITFLEGSGQKCVTHKYASTPHVTCN